MEAPLSPPYADQPGPPWAPPDPATRFDHGSAPVESPHRDGGPRRNRVTALVVVLALLLGIAGYALVDHNRSTSNSAPPARATSPATSSPASNSPATNAPTGRPPRATNPLAPATTAPPATTPAAGSGGVGAASASTTALSVGVVDVNTELGYQGSAAAGTGMVLTASGEVLTNNHVVEGSTSVTVTVVTTGRSYEATVVGTDPTADVAVLQLKDASGLEVAKLGDSSKVQTGDAVTAVGNAGGVGGAPSVKTGTVTDLDQAITASTGSGGESEDLTGLIQMNTALQPGDSGGPLYNAAGEVIGINTAGSARRRFPRDGTQTGTESFAIPIGTATDVAKQIESGTASDTITIGTPGFLGVELASDGSGTIAGASVGAIVADTPAEKAGLKEGDTIVDVDGHAVVNNDALGAALKGHHGGDKVSVTWTDGSGQQHTSSVTLIAGPAD